MSEITASDLNQVIRAVQVVGNAVNSVSAQTAQVSAKVNQVSGQVDRVNRDLTTLWYQFNEFVKEQRNANNLQQALTEIVRVRQELEEKFGLHDLARKRLRGIIDTAETGLLREFTISSCSEQIMLDTPKYWLAPSLVALAAWISDNEDLAKKAVAEAIRRDVEKSSLLFALVCSRTSNAATIQDRVAACFEWLNVYFNCQDPANMQDSVIVLIDSWANNLFGKDDGTCKDTFSSWMETLNEGKKLETEQKAHWAEFYKTFCVSTAPQYQVLANLSPEFKKADAYLQRINTADVIQRHFDKIRKAPINKKALQDRLDDQLNALISDFDVEEADLRHEEMRLNIIKECKGNMEIAEKEIAKKMPKQQKKKSFAIRLEEAIRKDDPDNKYSAARKTAIKEEFLGKYIQSAYTTFITENKEQFPKEITLQHKDWKGWSGKTTDGNNKDALNKSYSDHMDKCREKDLNSIDKTKAKKLKTQGIIVCAIAAVLAIIGIFAAPAIIVIGVIAGIIGVTRFMASKKEQSVVDAKIQQINDYYNNAIANGKKNMNAALEQWQKVLAVVNAFDTHPEKKSLNLTVEEDKA